MAVSRTFRVQKNISTLDVRQSTVIIHDALHLERVVSGVLERFTFLTFQIRHHEFELPLLPSEPITEDLRGLLREAALALPVETQIIERGGLACLGGFDV